MSGSTPRVKVALVQVREKPEVALHEQSCFVERCGLDPDLMTVINLVETPKIRWEQVADADMVILGGAAAHSATEDYDFTAPMTEVTQRLVDAGMPMFGSCWGHQFIARALGGEVITDRANEEVGTFGIHLTDAGLADDLLTGFPESFPAHMGHHDRVSRLPEGGVELARSQRCPNQIYRLAGKPVYGTQFHAEMSAQHLIERLSYYRDSYLPSDEEFESLKRNPLPTPEADTILHRFLDLVMA
ncbi:MAG: type 1 glutamine amidotransferase [Phycisphaerales bacterium]|nr:type 1 glutamine amidotransferase [Phycisphaerales bacterium]